MKLPDDPKERNQIFVLIGIVAVAVCVGIFFGFRTVKLRQSQGTDDFAQRRRRTLGLKHARKIISLIIGHHASH